MIKLNPSAKVNEIKKDLLLSSITSFLVILGIIVSTGILSRSLTHWDFATYLLLRRLSSVIENISSLGVQYSIPKIHQRIKGQVSPVYYSKFFKDVAFFNLLIFIIIVSTASLLARITAEFPYSLNAIILSSITLFLYSLYIVIYAIYRSNLDFKTANLLQIFSIGLWPIIASSLGGWMKSLEATLVLMIFPYIFCILYARKIFLVSRESSIDSNTYRECMVFGIGRIPYGLSFAAIISAPMVLLAASDGTRDLTLFGITVLIARTVEGGIDFVSRVALSRFAYLQENTANTKKIYTIYVEVALQCAVFCCIIFSKVVPFLISSWLGSGIEHDNRYYEFATILIMPVVSLSIMRPAIDALSNDASVSKDLFLFSLLGIVILVLVFYMNLLDAKVSTLIITIVMTVLVLISLLRLKRNIHVGNSILISLSMFLHIIIIYIYGWTFLNYLIAFIVIALWFAYRIKGVNE
jgi:O-antigen/teichoic acid export membrane protein